MGIGVGGDLGRIIFWNVFIFYWGWGGGGGLFESLRVISYFIGKGFLGVRFR